MRRRKSPGKGSTAHAGAKERHERRIVVSFDDETFAAVRARAVSNNSSFAEQVRTLVDWGLEAEERTP